MIYFLPQLWIDKKEFLRWKIHPFGKQYDISSVIAINSQETSQQIDNSKNFQVYS